jgi:hypothetical protein
MAEDMQAWLHPANSIKKLMTPLRFSRCERVIEYPVWWAMCD